MEGTEVLVLNGDLVDFRWSGYPSEKETMEAALRWVEGVIERFEGRAVHYVLGNHDCGLGYREELERLASKHAGFDWNEFRLELGRNLFLHGDCANRRMGGEDLVRFREAWSADRPKGRLSKALYDCVDAMGISESFHRWYFPKAKTVARVAYHLDEVRPEWREEIDHCFFGHTHRPFEGHRHEGVEFHNTGSGIRGMGFRPLTFNSN